MTGSQQRIRLVAVGLAAAVVALAVRWPHLDRGISGDELANLQAGTPWMQVWLPESSINPPLVRMVGASSSSSLELLRMLALLGGVASVALLPAIAVGLGAPLWLAALVGLVAAVHPGHVEVSTTARAYGWVQAALAGHVLALVTWLRQPSRGASWAVALTALLLPWLHYLSLPLLGVLALGMGGDRRRLALYLPALLAALPLLGIIVVRADARPPITQAPWTPLALMTQLGLHGFVPGDAWVRTVGEPVLLAGVALGILGALSGPTGGRSDRLARVLLLAPLLIVIPLAMVKTVRTPLTTVALVTLWPALIARLSRRRGGPVWAGLMVTWVGLYVWGEAVHPRYPVEVRDEVREVGRRLAELVPPGGVVHVIPAPEMQPLAYHASGLPPHAFAGQPACEGRRLCAVIDGRRIEGASGIDRPGIYLVIDARPFEAGPGRTAVTRHITRVQVDDPGGPPP